MEELKKNASEKMAQAIEQLKETNRAYLRGRIEGEVEAVEYMRAKMEQATEERSACG